MKFHFTATFGSEDPTRATLAFVHAKGAIEAGHEVTMALLGDSTVLFNPAVAENIHGVGLPPLMEVLGFLRERQVPIHG